MKTIFNTAKKVLLGLLPLGLLVMTPFLASCGDDNDDSGAAQMVINKVYLENASAEDSVYDREVSFARLGQLIRLEGSGFTGLKHVYVNGYDTYFNNALMTDNNVWITLNANTPVAKAEASVRNTIQLVKDNATYTYQFTIRASSPSRRVSTTPCHGLARRLRSMAITFRRRHISPFRAVLRSRKV